MLLAVNPFGVEVAEYSVTGLPPLAIDCTVTITDLVVPVNVAVTPVGGDGVDLALEASMVALCEIWISPEAAVTVQVPSARATTTPVFASIEHTEGVVVEYVIGLPAVLTA
jgi:hypothetical protein